MVSQLMRQLQPLLSSFTLLLAIFSQPDALTPYHRASKLIFNTMKSVSAKSILRRIEIISQDFIQDVNRNIAGKK